MNIYFIQSMKWYYTNTICPMINYNIIVLQAQILMFGYLSGLPSKKLFAPFWQIQTNNNGVNG